MHLGTLEVHPLQWLCSSLIRIDSMYNVTLVSDSTRAYCPNTHFRQYHTHTVLNQSEIEQQQFSHTKDAWSLSEPQLTLSHVPIPLICAVPAYSWYLTDPAHTDRLFRCS